VIRRFITWFTDFGIPVGGVIVNQVIREEPGADVPDFIRNRMNMQGKHLEEIERGFPGMVRAVLPLYDDEIRGTSSLDRASADLFA
jgi:arsenite/tail-anchored protein-transporting ATPase